MRHKMLSITQRLRLASICVLCNQYHHHHMAICDDCFKLFSPTAFACHYCALPLPEGDFLICGQCCKQRPSFDRIIAAYPFKEPLRTLLHEFKYHEGLYLSSFFAKLISNAVPTELLNTQCLIPVPLHPKRLRERGYNQSVELAKQVGRQLKIPYHAFYCQKIQNTAPQAELNAYQRQRNLRRAFCASALPFTHITLIDDLVTTGSTASAVAKVLKQQGVQRVDVWCCAKTIPL